MDELDELLWRTGGDGSSVSDADWQRILEHTFTKLSNFFGISLRFSDEPSIHNGFFASFESVRPTDDPLAIRLRGTYGVDFPGREYSCVQGFVYLYSGNLRLVALSGENHIYIRYARVDAPEDAWDMAGFNGRSAWRSGGWSFDDYGEFEGDEFWED